MSGGKKKRAMVLSVSLGCDRPGEMVRVEMESHESHCTAGSEGSGYGGDHGQREDASNEESYDPGVIFHL
ncbi:unnamed protein product [Dovyalis caffra]|uniref:Uncharacterized protein n=1 Tax=Dovyalis caffra TaxID=77055 RepID=A0AAV1S9V3_9ROSI|nr:unnamed protein product [Dovyalis caffra]